MLTYKGVVVAQSHKGFIATPGNVILDTCIFERESPGNYEVFRAHAWSLRCFDRYFNMVELDLNKMSSTIIPSSDNTMFTCQKNVQGNVIAYLR